MMKEKRLSSLDLSEFEGTLNELVTKLRALEFRAKADGYAEVVIKDESYGDGYDLVLYGLREETPEERLQREGQDEREKRRKIENAKLAIERNKQYLKEMGVEV